MRTNTSKAPADVDGYLARLPDEQRGALQRLRRTIKAAAPRAEETISYQLPAFRLDGQMLVWFGAARTHCAFYPGGLVQEFAAELGRFETSKGTIRFQPDQPLPAALVRRIVKTKIAANAARAALKTRKAKAR